MKVRTILAVFLLAAAVFWGGDPHPAAAEAGSPCLPQRQVPVTILVRTGPGRSFTAMESDGPEPFIDADAGRTIVPLRALVTALSPGTDGVHWDAGSHTASFWYQGHTLSVSFPGNTDRTYTAKLDNQPLSLTAYLCGGRVWVPARTVAEAFHVDIQYVQNHVVLIDGAGPDPQSASQAPHRLTSACPAAGDGLFAAARQAATAVACQLAAAQ